MKTLITVLLGLVMITNMYAETSKSIYIEYVNGGILLDSLEDAEVKLQSQMSDIDKGLAHFRVALLSGDAEKIGTAFEYWEGLYNNKEFKNPLALAYVATLEAMYAGAMDAGPIKKTRMVKSSIAKFDMATEQILTEDDSFATYYVYFLRSRTYVNLPTFFREFKKETLPNLDIAEDYLKKASKTNFYDETFVNHQYANIYSTIGKWYDRKKKYDKSIKSYKKAARYIAKQDKKRAEYFELLQKEVEAKK